MYMLLHLSSHVYYIAMAGDFNINLLSTDSIVTDLLVDIQLI